MTFGISNIFNQLGRLCNMSPFGMNGSAFQGGFPSGSLPAAPTVNIARTGPDTCVEGTGSLFWQVTYNGTVTDYNLVVADVTKVGTPAGVVSIQNGTTATAQITFASISGLGDVSFIVEPGACQNEGVDNEQSAESNTGEVVVGK